jgi:hypothetical protein
MDLKFASNKMPDSLSNLERDVQSLISNLKFISKVRPGEKFNITAMTVVENSWWNRAIRTFTGTESRTRTYKFIYNVVQNSIKIAELNLSSNSQREKQLGELILSQLEESQHGLESLIETYGDDRMFTSCLETFLKLMQTKILSLSKT